MPLGSVTEQHASKAAFSVSQVVSELKLKTYIRVELDILAVVIGGVRCVLLWADGRSRLIGANQRNFATRRRQSTVSTVSYLGLTFSYMQSINR